MPLRAAEDPAERPNATLRDLPTRVLVRKAQRRRICARFFVVGGTRGHWCHLVSRTPIRRSVVFLVTHALDSVFLLVGASGGFHLGHRVGRAVAIPDRKSPRL